MKPGPTRHVVAENLRKTLKTHGIGINECADKAGVSRSQFYDVLGAKKATTIDWLARVGKVLDVDVWKLLQPSKKRK